MASGCVKERLIFEIKSSKKSNDLEKKILDMQKKEMSSETFKIVSIFLDRYKRREAIGKEKDLFEILEIGDFNRLRFFLNSLLGQELKSNVYLGIAKKSLRKIMSNCQMKLSKLSNEPVGSNGILSFELSKDVEANLIERVDLGIYNILNEQEKEIIEILDKDNIQIYKEYNKIVDRVDDVLIKMYIIAFKTIASDTNIVVDSIDLNTNLKKRNIVLKYHVIEKANNELAKDSVFVRNQVINRRIYTVPYYLSGTNLENRQKVLSK